MADTTTTTEPTDTNTSEGATPTSQGMFVTPTAQPPQQAGTNGSQADQRDQQAPKPGPPAAKTGDEGNNDTDDGKGDGKGKGSKEAVLADLAAERDKRQETEQRLTAVLEALGINHNAKDADPEQLTADLQAQRAENAVLRHGQGVADTEALLDSKRFTDSLTNVDVTDGAAVKAHIEQFVTDNPRYAPNGTSGPTPGVRDAAANTPPASTEKDWLRASIRR